MRILAKYPTRGRPAIFLERLQEYIRMAAKPEDIAFLVSCDADDATMTDAVIERAKSLHPFVTVVRGNSKTKIQACNADLLEYQKPWDVVLLISDDFFCVKQGWDECIRKNMQRHFPGTDGALWFFDGAQRSINTLECVGRKRFERFGYLYHGSYASFFCDNESTAVGLRDGTLIFIDEPIAAHHHPVWLGGMKRDATYERNNKYWKQDQANYHRRKAIGFPP